MAATQVCRNGGASDFGIGHDDIRCREAQVEIETGEALKCDATVVPRAFIGGEQTDGRNIGCQVERVGGKCALQCLPSICSEGEHAFGAVAVEFNIDTRQADGAAHDIGPRLDREPAEAAAGQRLLSRPDQCVAQRSGIGGERAFDLQSVGLRLIAPSKAAFIGAPETRSFTPLRLPASASGKSASVRLASIGASCQMKRPVAPKLFGNRRPGQREFYALQCFGDLAVLRRGLRRCRPRCAFRRTPRADVPPTWLRISASISPDQLDWPFGCNSIAMFGRSSETSAISTRPISSGKNRRRAVNRSARARLLGIAEHHIGEADAAGRKQRDAGLAAQDRLESGHCADFAQDLLANGIGGNQVPGCRENEQPARHHGEQDKSQAFQAGGGCQMEVSGCFGVKRRRTIASVPLGPTLDGLCDPFMAGDTRLSLPGCRRGVAARIGNFGDHLS